MLRRQDKDLSGDRPYVACMDLSHGKRCRRTVNLLDIYVTSVHEGAIDVLAKVPEAMNDGIRWSLGNLYSESGDH